jgi:2-dehydropantoate 2-reductase
MAPAQTCVIGAGSLGLLWTALLAQSQAIARPVDLVSRRTDLCSEINASGITVNTRDGKSWRAAPGTVRGLKPEAVPRGHYDMVLGLTKTYESDYAVELAVACIGRDGVIVALQNGLNARDALRRRLPAGGYVAGVAYTGARADAAARVMWNRPGGAALGLRTDNRAQVKRAAAWLRSTGLPCDDSVDEPALLWRKLIVTCSNWVCISCGLPVGALLRSDGARGLLWDLMQELAPVGASAGAALPLSQLSADLDVLLAESRQSTGSAYNALVRGERPEVDDLCQSVIDQSDAVGLQVPRTRLLQQLSRVQAQQFLKEREQWR